MWVSKVDLQMLEKHLSKTNEINIGFDIFDRACFQITDGDAIAYAIVYNLFDERPELARFFVPLAHRDFGFGKFAAVALINHLFETRSQLLIDPINDSIGFWEKVAEFFGDRVDYEEIDYPKSIWRKNNKRFKTDSQRPAVLV